MIKIIRIIGLVIILCSIVPLGVGVYWYQRTDNFLDKAARTQAIVSGIEERNTNDGTLYYPVFSFVDGDGVEHTIRSRTGSYPSPYEIGDSKAIFYDPQDPEKTKFDSFFSLWLGPVISGVVGIVPIFVGALVIFVIPLIIRGIGSDTAWKRPHLKSEIQTAISKEVRQDRTWGLFCHLSSLAAFLGIPFGNIIGPVVIWLIKRDEIPFVDVHGKESVNFQISMTLYSILSFFLMFAVIGFILFPAIAVMDLVLVIVASVKANKGEMYHYPLTIRFIQ